MENQLKNRPPLTPIELSGKPYEIGRQYGARLKQTLAKLVEAILYGTDPWGFRSLSKDQVAKLARKFSPYLEDYSPELVEEIKGIAEGSGRTYEEILMLNLHEERRGFSTAQDPVPLLDVSRCTGFAATGRATANGETFIGQNWDAPFRSIAWNNSILLKEKRDVGPDLLAYAFAGISAAAGINSEGICLTWTSVPSLGYQVGVPTYCIAAEILHQKRIGDAIEAVLRAKRAGCFQFFIGDATEIYSVEATPSDVDVTYASKYLAHSNHYISEKFRAKQDMSRLNGSTIHRYNRISKILEESCGKIDLNLCMNTFKDHVNYPLSICRHPMTEEKIEGITYDSWVIMPAKKEWWLARGPACLNEYKKYTV